MAHSHHCLVAVVAVAADISAAIPLCIDLDRSSNHPSDWAAWLLLRCETVLAIYILIFSISWRRITSFVRLAWMAQDQNPCKLLSDGFRSFRNVASFSNSHHVKDWTSYLLGIPSAVSLIIMLLGRLPHSGMPDHEAAQHEAKTTPFLSYKGHVRSHNVTKRTYCHSRSSIL